MPPHIKNARACQSVAGNIQICKRRAFFERGHRFCIPKGVFGEVERVQEGKTRHSRGLVDAILAQVQLSIERSVNKER